MAADREAALAALGRWIVLVTVVAAAGCGPRPAAVGSRGDILLADRAARRAQGNAARAPELLALAARPADVDAWRHGRAGALRTEAPEPRPTLVVAHTRSTGQRRAPLAVFLSDPDVPWTAKALGLVVLTGACGGGRLPGVHLGKVKIRPADIGLPGGAPAGK